MKKLDHKRQNLSSACNLKRMPFLVKYVYKMYHSWKKSRKPAS